MPIRKIDAVAIALVLVYFATLPKIEQPAITATFFIFWLLAYSCDALSTLRSRNMAYETNRLFASVARVLGPVPALVVHFAVEVLFITFLPFIFLRTLSIEGSAFIAMAVGLLHAYAAVSNSRFRPSSTDRSIYFGYYRLHALYILQLL